MISFTSFGAAKNVTGSCHLLCVDDEQYLLDCGIFQGNPELEVKNMEEFGFDPKEISHVLLSHAHADHSGRLPLLVRQGFNGNIYCTSATRDLSHVILTDAVKVGEMYTEADVMETVDHFRTHFYGKEKKLSSKFTYTSYNAGHILGSAFLSLQLKPKQSFLKRLFSHKQSNTVNILYTGDIGRKNNPIVNDPCTDIPAPDYIFMEATYGDRLHENVSQALSDVAEAIVATVDRGGKVLIPTFAVERSQEIIYHLKVLMAKGAIPKVPIYLDSPMATTATGVFQIHPECFNQTLKDRFIAQGKNPFSVSSLHVVKNNKESVSLAKSKKPCIILAGNGMCTAGRILNHLQYGLANKNNSVLLVGYSAENTLSAKLKDGAEYVNLNGKEIFVQADILTTGAFSAHADYKEMLDWLKAIDTSKLKRIYLVHGNDESLKTFANYLKDNGFEDVVIVEEKKKYKLD